MDIKQKLSSYPRVHFNMARVYLMTGDLKAAKINADKEFEMNPTLDTSLYIVGEVARLQAKYSEAIEKLEKAIAINPRSVDSLMSLGWIKLKQNFYSEAFELYNRAFREDRNNPEIHKMLGYCYKASGQRALAKEKFEDYLKLSPGASDRAEIEGLIRLLQ
jgi:tetratricopeptide (TPR) repeat protein